MSDLGRGILRKTFRGFARAWFDKQAAIAIDGPALQYEATPEVCIADWRELDAGPLLQRGAINLTASVDARGQAWIVIDVGPGRQCWRLGRITAGASDGGTGFIPRVGWWLTEGAPAGLSFTPQLPIQEPQELKTLPAVNVAYADLNASLPAYHFGRYGTGTVEVNRIWNQVADGRFLNLRIDTGAGSGSAVEVIVEFAALRSDEINQIQIVGRETYRGDQV